MQVCEENEALPQPAVLGLDRLLHLHQQLAGLPHLVDSHDAGANRLIDVVGERAPLASACLDEHVVAALDQLAGAGGCQCDTVFVRLDFPGHADFHAGQPYLSRR